MDSNNGAAGLSRIERLQKRYRQEANLRLSAAELTINDPKSKASDKGSFEYSSAPPHFGIDVENHQPNNSCVEKSRTRKVRRPAQPSVNNNKTRLNTRQSMKVLPWAVEKPIAPIPIGEVNPLPDVSGELQVYADIMTELGVGIPTLQVNSSDEGILGNMKPVQEMDKGSSYNHDDAHTETSSQEDPDEAVVDQCSRSRSASPDIPDGQYEVETILDYFKDSQAELYFIKWKGWEDKDNTWEPIQNLMNCSGELWRFYQQRLQENQIDSRSLSGEEPERKRKKGRSLSVPPDPRPMIARIDEFLNRLAKPVPLEEIEHAYKQQNKKRTKWDEEKISRYLTKALVSNLSLAQEEQLRTEAVLQKAEFLASESQKQLAEWCKHINAITNGKPKIFVENFADLAGPPKDFTYINNYAPSPGIVIPNDPPVGCSCTSSCSKNKKSCCPSLFGHAFAYTSNKRLNVPQGSPIYECNVKCTCGDDCSNKVVQDGVSPLNGMQFCIFRTKNGCGWGVKTLKTIKKGTFVCLYVGEIIKTEEAERRGKDYDQEGSTYLFDLDFNDDENCPYTVDAAKYGNVSHFMNHSCDPNLAVFGVWSDCLDPNLPKLALFALRDIPKLTELTFDYKSHKGTGEEEGYNIPLIKTKACLCGADNCRKLLF